jgi:hypothetical protein
MRHFINDFFAVFHMSVVDMAFFPCRFNSVFERDNQRKKYYVPYDHIRQIYSISNKVIYIQLKSKSTK